jgi:hypothetical protein
MRCKPVRLTPRVGINSQRENSSLISAITAGNFSAHESGRSVAWLARLFRVQEVVSSNLTAPTIFSGAFEEVRFSGQLKFVPDIVTE